MARMQTKQEIFDRVVEIVDKLPPIPANILDLRRAVADPNVEFSQLVPLLKKDPGLAADLLKFANSARYGVEHHVDTIEEAVRYFGMTNLVEFVTAAFAEHFVRSAFTTIRGLDAYFTHSREISGAARQLAIHGGFSSHDCEAYALVGLLHDIGKLVLIAASHTETLPLISGFGEKMRAVVEHEQELWGIDHCEVGAAICKKWNFPELFQVAIIRHHTPGKGADFSMPGGIIYLGHVITIPGITNTVVRMAIPEPDLGKMNLTYSALLEIATDFMRHSTEKSVRHDP